MKRTLCVGHAVQDFVFSTPQIPQLAEKHRATGFSIVGGGPAATAAVAISKLGGHAQLVARVGDDVIADAIQRELEGYGVDCRHLHRFPGFQSSVSAVFVDARGERLIVNHTDALLPTDPSWLESSVSLEGVDVVLADTRWPEGAIVMLKRAREAGLPAVLDADVPVPKAGPLLQSATHVAFSMAGLKDYAECSDAMPDIEQALRQTAIRLKAWCCVTMGGDGVLIADGRDDQDSLTARTIPAFPVKPVDTLGAGDVWHGAFALALAEGADEISAVRAASAAAAIKVTRTGGRAGAPTRVERDSLLEST
jgi:sulfofructose kinase